MSSDSGQSRLESAVWFEPLTVSATPHIHTFCQEHVLIWLRRKSTALPPAAMTCFSTDFVLMNV